MLSIWPISSQEIIQPIEFEKVVEVKSSTFDSEPLIRDCDTGTMYKLNVNGGMICSAAEIRECKLLVEAEAGNQGPDGMWYVFSVLCNRVADPDFPGTFHEVINQYRTTSDGRRIFQFESVANGMLGKVNISKNCEEAFARIQRGEVAPYLIAFERKESNVLEQWFMPAFDYRDHRFYTKK